MRERMQVRRIVLTAPGRNYDVRLRPGVNLITGPISTGKTSILKLIDFALGGGKPPSYPEISKCSDVLVEFVLGTEPITIRRSLRAADSKALVYSSSLDAVLLQNAPSIEVQVRHHETAASISSEVMNRLSLGRIEVKTAPTQEASSLSAFSVRDLLMLVRVDQDRMGSTKAFFEEHFAKEIKWKAGFEIIHGFYDQAVAALSASLLEAERSEAALKQQLDAARGFLDQFKIADVDSLRESITRLEGEEADLRQRISNTSSGLRPEDRELAKQRAALEQAQRRVNGRRTELRRTLEQLGRLRVQYERERSQIEFLRESAKIIGTIPVVRCPACFQTIPRTPSEHECHVCTQQLVARPGEVSVAARLRSVRRRINDLDTYLKEMELELAKLDLQKVERDEDLRKLDLSLRLIEQAQMLPHTRGVVELAQALSAAESKRQRSEEHLKLRLKARGEGSNLLELQERVSKLKAEVEASVLKKADPEQVIHSLSAIFSAFLASVKYPNLSGARLDRETYHPVLRGQDYSELSSKGAIALAITCWHLSLLRYALTQDSRFPLFLMLDSPLSHVGHDATDSAFRDQQIVDAFYVVLAELHQKHGEQFQILICDNRPPQSARGMIAVEFSGIPNVGRFGLVDDEQGAVLPEAPSIPPDGL